MIRLQRTGRRNDPSFRIVVGEKIYAPTSGKHLAYLGSYNPKTKVAIIDDVKVKEMIAKGAQLSGTVHNLFLSKGIITGKKINVLPKKTVPKKDEPAAEAPAAEIAPEAVPEVASAEAEAAAAETAA